MGAEVGRCCKLLVCCVGRGEDIVSLLLLFGVGRTLRGEEVSFDGGIGGRLLILLGCGDCWCI